MPMRMRLSRDERRLRLLLAAIEVFGEKGYRKTEVSEIVHRAGVTKPMLYRHFPGGKAEIYMEVLDDHLQSMMRKLGEAMAKAEAPLDALRRGIDAYLRFAEENPEAFHLLAETSAELDPGIVDRLKEVRSTIADGLADTIGAVLKEADLSPEGAPVYAHVLLGGVESVVAWWLETKLLERSAVVTYLLTLLWRGFEGLPRGESRIRLELSRLIDLPRVVAEYGDRTGKIFKRYQVAPVWRADRPGRGRFREFYQCDVDVVGPEFGLADAEVILVVTDALAAVGLKSFEVRLNSRKVLRGLIESYGIDPAREADVLVALDKFDKIGEAGVAGELRERGVHAPRLIHEIARPGEALRRDLGQSEIGRTGLDEVDRLIDLVGPLVNDGAVTFSPALARGLSYYT